MTIGKILCVIRRKHAWRKARKGEDAGSKYCKQCDARVAVKKRKPKSGPAGSGVDGRE